MTDCAIAQLNPAFQRSRALKLSSAQRSEGERKSFGAASALVRRAAAAAAAAAGALAVRVGLRPRAPAAAPAVKGTRPNGGSTLVAAAAAKAWGELVGIEDEAKRAAAVRLRAPAPSVGFPLAEAPHRH